MIHRKLSHRNASGKTLNYIYRGDGHEHKVSEVYHVASQCFAQDPIIRDTDGVTVDINTDFLEAELDAMAEKNQRSDIRFAHYIISLPSNEVLSLKQWEEVVRYYLQTLGYGECTKWTAALHNDTDNQHIHILVCRVDPELGYRLVTDSNDHAKGMAAMRLLECQYGLSVTPSPADTWGVDVDVCTLKVLQKIECSEDGDGIWINRIRTRLAHAVEQSRGGTFASFLENCRENGVDPIIKLHPDGYPVGISYGLEGRYLSGSKIKSTRLTFPALTGQKYCPEQREMMPTGRSSEGISYDHDRDFPNAKLCADKTLTKRDFSEISRETAAVSAKLPKGSAQTVYESENSHVHKGVALTASAPLTLPAATVTGKSGIDELLTLENLYIDLALHSAHQKSIRRLKSSVDCGMGI
jgi:hypothetical protein